MRSADGEDDPDLDQCAHWGKEEAAMVEVKKSAIDLQSLQLRQWRAEEKQSIADEVVAPGDAAAVAAAAQSLTLLHTDKLRSVDRAKCVALQSLSAAYSSALHLPLSRLPLASSLPVGEARDMR
jgi:hypothetical protein